MTEKEYIQLYEKYINGLCSPEEVKRLLSFKDEFELSDRPWDDELFGEKQTVKNYIHKRLNYNIQKYSRYKILLPIKWLVAASIILALAFSIYWLKNESVQFAENNRVHQPQNPVLPATNKAILTLADGSRIALDSAGNGILANQGNTVIRQSKNGELTYKAKSADEKMAGTMLNTISTPRGGHFHVVLPDGTKVWLNAASSLSFPATLNGSERRVNLTGEAYFEVAKKTEENKAEGKRIPFIVTAGSQQVEVLGTHFNINAYTDEEAIETTLLEGSVKVSHLTSHISRLLQPGQQALVTRVNETIVVKPANITKTMAWKNGYFMFMNENITSIMREISRWYDVDVVYHGDMSGKDFGGTISRFADVSEVLKTMELTRIVHFNIHGRRIEVMP